LHICYCHTPMRYACDLTFDYLNNSKLGKGIPGIFTRYLLHRLREWDVISANRVDYFIANSQHTARRIWRCYRREAEVIYPPVDVEKFPFKSQKQDFYLTVCRLVSYKKISLIVEAFNQLRRDLIVIGTGEELNKLRHLAKSNVKIMGWQPEEVVTKYMSEAKGFIYAACEDFGMALVEAQACGTPVIAYGVGGATETVLDMRKYPDSATGLLFSEQTEKALIEAVEKFENSQAYFQTEIIRKHAYKFSPEVFQNSYLNFVENCYEEFKSAGI
ncbi:MAG: glycosyltransferase family 4 protein, partial [Okeania sp. SIO3C4]|nr:glycosyltransferase family 4 protein [Okeania sp. SIO3C4]